MPADAEVDNWLTSSPVEVGEGDAALEVWISARPLSDGRIEFALQVRFADGIRGERLLPRSRFLPADSEQDVWLPSSPLTPEAG